MQIPKYDPLRFMPPPPSPRHGLLEAASPEVISLLPDGIAATSKQPPAQSKSTSKHGKYEDEITVRLAAAVDGDHRYLVLYLPGDEGKAIVAIGKWGRNPDIPLKWRTAKQLMKNVMESQALFDSVLNDECDGRGGEAGGEVDG